ncbi:MAG: class I SAM-dependent methyltransferase [Erysipelotrichaceae bacterium]|nr:class I SAM-dependent methyltransferase [Erysipelotrichaceae bacterium]
MMDYQDINAKTIDKWVNDGWTWGIPIDHETYINATKGEWDVKLTPNKFVPHDWLGDLKGKKLLGLASGGAQQMPIFCASGARCTVLDYADSQLDSERMVAEREGYSIDIIKTDMSKPLPFKDECFDIIFHPVSNLYVKDVKSIWKECYRILKKGGTLLAGLDNGINFLFDDEEKMLINSLPFDPLANAEQMKQLADTDSGVQFSHTIDEQLGGQLEAGFVLQALYEDTNESGRLFELNIPTYIASKAIKM